MQCAGTFIDLIFILEIMINFNTSYLNDEMKYETNRSAIAINYLRSWFLIDFVSVLPKLMSIFLPSGSSSANSLKMVKILRITRVTKVMRILRVFKVLK